MGILNITPDSFFDGGKYTEEIAIKSRFEKLIAEGVDIIDIGAYSSRPGAKHIDLQEEWNRLSKALKVIRNLDASVCISVDTFRSEIAKRAVTEFNVNIINDISGGELDSEMFETIAALHVPYIMMHIKGTPQNMQINPTYENLIKEIMQYFSEKLTKLKRMGVNDVVLDLGFGFGKSLDDNYKLLKHLEDFLIFEHPILVGISRKSMIYKELQIKPENALNGTTALHASALLKGASILRVHDVKEAKETIQLIEKLK